MELKKKTSEIFEEKIGANKYLVVASISIILLVLGFVFIQYVFALGYAPAVNDPQPMFLFYKFNNASAVGESYNGNGTVIFDYSSTLINATTRGDMVYNPTGGYLGDGAYNFDGVNDGLTSISSFNMTPNNITVAFWFKKGNNGATKRMIYHRSGNFGFLCQTETADRVSCLMGTGSALPIAYSSALNNETWYHLAFTRSATQTLLYINGKLNATQTITGSFEDYPMNLSIGFDGSTSFFNGSLDEMIIYNTTLTAQEITDLYQSYAGCYPTTENWDIDCSLQCKYNENYNIAGNLTLTGNGSITINGNMTFNSTNQYIFLNSGCQINLNRGGSII